MAEVSRTERRKAGRQSRKERKQKGKETHGRAARVQKLSVYVIGLLLFAGAGYWGYSHRSTEAPGDFVPTMGNRHITPGQIGLSVYNSNPPTSGPHLPSLARWGTHENPIAKELQVHNLEDGGVLVQYNCEQPSKDCRELVAKLAEIVMRYNHAILAPYPGMTHKIALTAWARIDKFNGFDEDRIVRFIDAYINLDHHPRGGR